MDVSAQCVASSRKLTYKVESDTITIIEACGRFSYAELADSIHEVLSLFTVKSDKRKYSANQLLEHLQRTPGYRTLSLETMDQVCSLGITLTCEWPCTPSSVS